MVLRREIARHYWRVSAGRRKWPLMALNVHDRERKQQHSRAWDAHQLQLAREEEEGEGKKKGRKEMELTGGARVVVRERERG